MPWYPRREWSTRIGRTLRKNMTEPEVLLWACLREDLSAKFRRQEPIDRYVVDFVCYSRRLVVEVDGSQHVDSEADRVRDARLAELGFRVLRFTNGEVMAETAMVLETISNALFDQGDIHPSRPPRRRRDRPPPAAAPTPRCRRG